MGRPAAPLPFIGRDRELSELKSLLSEACAGRGVAAVVTGEPGIGKTRLCEELVAEANARGLLVCTARGNPLLSEVPFAVISALLRSATDQLSPAKQASVTAGLPGLEGVTAQGHIHDHLVFREAATFDAVGEFFKRLCSMGPVVAYVDGVESADDPSVRSMGATMDRMHSRPFMLLMSTRRDTAAFESALGASRAMSALHLSRLSQESSEALVTMLRPAISPSAHRALVRDGCGLPAYLAASLGQASDGACPPDPLKVMGNQLDSLWIRLSEPAREMSRLLAAAGNTVSEVLLLRLWPADNGFTSALREVLDADLAVLDASGVQLSHPSYGRILLARMFDLERRDYHRRFATELARSAGAADGPALADHLLQLRDEVDPGILRKALAGAVATPGVPDEYLCLYLERLLEILPADEEPRLRYELYSKLGAAQQRTGELELARGSWRHAIDDALVGGSVAVNDLGSAQTQLAFQEWETGTATEDGNRRYDQYRAALYNLIWTTRHGSVEQNLDAARAAISLKEAPPGAPLAELGHCMTDWTYHRYEDARQHALEAFRTAEGEDVKSVALICLSRLAPLTGHLQDSIQAVTTLMQSSADSGLPIGEGATRSWAALTEHLAGNLKAAEEQLRPAVVVAAQTGAGLAVSRLALLTALLHAERGQLKAAAASLADAQRVRGETVWQADLEGLLTLVRSLIALTGGQPERVPPAVSLTAGNYPVLTLMLPFNSGLAGVKTGDSARVIDCLAMLDVHPAQGKAVHALRMRLQGLDLVSRGNTREGAQLLEDAANMLHECGLNLYASQSRLEWAETVEPRHAALNSVPDLLRYFKEQDVGWWFQRARRLARSVGYVEDRSQRNGRALSPREAEVVEQTTLGLSNAAIAERLFLSERTVESHMRNVYRRLGLSSRVSLVAWAAEHPQEFSTGTDAPRKPSG